MLVTLEIQKPLHPSVFSDRRTGAVRDSTVATTDTDKFVGTSSQSDVQEKPFSLARDFIRIQSKILIPYKGNSRKGWVGGTLSVRQFDNFVLSIVCPDVGDTRHLFLWFSPRCPDEVLEVMILECS